MTMFVSRWLLIVALSIGITSSASARGTCTSMQVLLNISSSHREDVMAYIAPRLKESMGVNLVAEEMGSENMVERVNAQRSNPRITIAHWDVVVGKQLCDEGLCQPIDFEKVPNATKLYHWAYTHDRAGATTIISTDVKGIGLLYNEKEFDRAGIPAPTSWNDLKRPKLAGRISITAPASTWGTAALVQWAKMGGGGETNIEPGFKFAQSLMPNVNTVHTWSSELSNLMQLSEVWLATSASHMAAALRAKGLPIRWVLPKEGAPLINGGVSIVKGSPCQDEAHAYLNLYYSKEFQLLRMRKSGIASPLQAAWDELSESARSQMDLNPRDFDKLVDLDWHEINKHRSSWIKSWQREIR